MQTLNERDLVCVARIPPSRTLVARARRASEPALRRAAVRMLGVFGDAARMRNDDAWERPMPPLMPLTTEEKGALEAAVSRSA